MSGFQDNPFGEPMVDNPFAVSCNVSYARFLCILARLLS